jgi:formylglycine-generating enzyme required for sulfatase activity
MRRHLLAIGCALGLGAPASAVTIDWVTVGDPGNACDPQSDGCYGAVAYTYRISKYEVTNAQYAEFLNAVAADDTYGLYNATYMGDPRVLYSGGITRSGSPGSFTYSLTPGALDPDFWAQKPVNWVSWYDALRFANWLHNGQPSGAQDSSTTEDGAYTFSSATSVSTRNADATIFLTSEDEWYKAAYYDASTSTYNAYPFAGINDHALCRSPDSQSNAANCVFGLGYPSDVGAYTNAPSEYATFDQGGNVWEWNESIFFGGDRGLRGGGFESPPEWLAASYRRDGNAYYESKDIGFRVAMIPEPGTGLLLMTGVLGLSTWRRRSG